MVSDVPNVLLPKQGFDMPVSKSFLRETCHLSLDMWCLFGYNNTCDKSGGSLILILSLCIGFQKFLLLKMRNVQLLED